ncbi:AAA family ATPase [Rheinheimera aquimaris]|uniref:AAA family ATPase n=1 Tax=Rheinheimera aquimaris TaxID=412437 RepID=UPI003A9857F8
MNKLILTPLSTIMSQVYQANWLVENFFEKGSLNMVFGEPGTYKSFLAMELAFCISKGLDWYGNSTFKGDVIYLAGEGFSGIQKRVTALESKYSTHQQGIYVSSKPAEIINANSVSEVLKAIDDHSIKPVLIVVDTLHRNLGEGDENSSKDIGLFIKNLDLIKTKTNAAVLCIHHSGHGDKGHSRGSSAIRASLDSEYQLKAKENGVELTCKKMKEFEKPDSMQFVLSTITVNSASGSVESAFLELTNLGSTRSSRYDQIFEILKDMINSKGQPLPSTAIQTNPSLIGKKGVLESDLRTEAYSALKTDMPKPSSQQSTYRRAINKLLNDRLIIVADNYIVLA